MRLEIYRDIHRLLFKIEESNIFAHFFNTHDVVSCVCQKVVHTYSSRNYTCSREERVFRYGRKKAADTIIRRCLKMIIVKHFIG